MKLKQIRKLTKKEAKEFTNTDDLAICPHCGEVIDELFYAVDMSGWGRADLNGKYQEEKGNEFKKGAEWTCPECYKPVLPLKGKNSSL